MRRLRVLVSAYACNPVGNPRLHPGEDFVGWQLVGQLAIFHELLVITHDYNGPEIQREQNDKGLKGPLFIYAKLPTFRQLLYRVSLEERIYYFL
jgi:hypothetical protein